ncbi:mediator of RNA polymerase II transcription subunit 30-like [Exaiptasia diaphana]|uniref:Mediator of RNA polymerase II transcription subunit 30 n=1 Tax=Exaiptasia diaphana TaxID=2652724 RepID=A0A913WX70_EXADI|nr:mediator of RNA polymerase II transcription subunit 30-like [Exaiptasia diaphana]
MFLCCDIPLVVIIACSDMDAWSAQSSLPQREDEKSAQQGKIPIIQIENEVSLTIQGQRAVQDIVDKALELFRRLQNFKLSSETTTTSRQSQMHFSDVIPFKGESSDSKMEVSVDESLVKEQQQLQQLLKKKNEQIKELMDVLRTMIWDINTMVALKPS